MSGSFQDEIPAARINLRLSLHIGEARKKVELPLKLLVTGDFSSGRDDRALSACEEITVSRNNVNSVLAEFSLSTSLTVGNTLAGDRAEENVGLRYREIKDFEPEQIARYIELNEQGRVLLPMKEG